MQPDRSGTEAPVEPVRTPRGRLVLPLVVAGAVIVVLATALEGRPTFVPPQLGGDGGVQRAPGAAPSQQVATPPPVVPPPVTANAVVQTVLLVLVVLVAAVGLVVLIRALVLLLRKRRRGGLRSPGGAEEAAEAQAPDAPAVLRGIAAALVALDEDRAAGDAVVRAWLGLQQAAEDAGFARSPAETPTEFTGRVLSRTGADRTALRTLLRLYLRARFGDGAISAGDAGDARQALRALAASWERVAAAEGA